ncbi:hypothetical protein HS088_TW01G00728 [Tripterygium wilfordii]|uniref:Uncharacterized protein n=1 Tax=Tripterygium wilfordii TaxID=458696 RepID=A0A7J7E2E1_TRIWF|nr:hypothetical protein HS088_TW01G00728 [Tripterygium wilfordii]
MESLDSLWFYGNVLASTRRSTDQPLLDLGAAEIQAKAATPSPRCLKSCCDQLGISQPVMIPKAPVETEKPKEKERRRKRKSNGRRKIFGELDYLLGFERKVYCGSWMLMEEKKCGFGGENDQVKMPPLNDGMAMKEHLKSWAHAVACTVR